MSATKLSKSVRLLKTVGSKANTYYLPLTCEAAVKAVAMAAAFVEGGNVTLIDVQTPELLNPDLASAYDLLGLQAHGPTVELLDDISSTQYPFGRTLWVGHVVYNNKTYPVCFESYADSAGVVSVRPHGHVKKFRDQYGAQADNMWTIVALIMQGHDIALVQQMPDAHVAKPVTVARALELWSHHYNQQFAIRQGTDRSAVYAESKKAWREAMDAVDANFVAYKHWYTRKDAIHLQQTDGMTYEEAVYELCFRYFEANYPEVCQPH